MHDDRMIERVMACNCALWRPLLSSLILYSIYTDWHVNLLGVRWLNSYSGILYLSDNITAAFSAAPHMIGIAYTVCDGDQKYATKFSSWVRQTRLKHGTPAVLKIIRGNQFIHELSAIKIIAYCIPGLGSVKRHRSFTEGAKASYIKG